MTDSYQAIDDAVRSRISGGNIGEAVQECARSAFDISYVVPSIAQSVHNAADEYRRPSVLFRPALSIDGNQWCALYGNNLHDGVAGFGDTPELAMYDFDKNFANEKIKVMK